MIKNWGYYFILDYNFIMILLGDFFIIFCSKYFVIFLCLKILFVFEIIIKILINC